jgi:hypothetical protein
MTLKFGKLSADQAFGAGCGVLGVLVLGFDITPIKYIKRKKRKKPATILVIIEVGFLTGAPQLGHNFASELTSFLHS